MGDVINFKNRKRQKEVAKFEETWYDRKERLKIERKESNAKVLKSYKIKGKTQWNIF